MERIKLNIDLDASQQDIAEDINTQIGFWDISRELARAIKINKTAEVYQDGDVFVARFDGVCMVNERSTGTGDSAFVETDRPDDAAERWRTGEL